MDNVSTKKENNIWNQKITNWNAFLTSSNIKGISNKRKIYYDRLLKKAKQNLYSLKSEFFTKRLPQKEHWRLYDFFKDDAIYLDIETAGIKKKDITIIGLFDGIETKTMVKGINLDFNILANTLKRYKMLISFNGSVFDSNYIKKINPNVIPNIPHFDLRFACQKIGLKGSLKEIEKKLNIKRTNTIVQNLRSGDPYKLWKMYMASGDKYYLKLLIDYNSEDIINLRKIADLTYSRLKKMHYPHATNKN